MPSPFTSVKIRGQRKRQFARAILDKHILELDANPLTPPIRVVCISDNHNTRPAIPQGDLLIHAGDLTENGSFDEVQAGLTWLSAQPHRYKVFVAGNHDVLLDEAFLEKYPERRYGEARTKKDLDWGSVIYLEDGTVTLDFPLDDPTHSSRDPPSSERRHRSLVVYGSPWTPQYGISAFQYRPDCESHWDDRLKSLSPTPDIIVTHGPPQHHLDKRDFHRAGCPYLGSHISELRPRLHIFGHIHVAYGRETVSFDSVRRIYEDVLVGWAGWEAIAWMAILVLWGRVRRIFLGAEEQKVTTLVNASVVGGPENELRNPPIVVEL